MAGKNSIFDLADKFGYVSPWDNWSTKEKEPDGGPLITDMFACISKLAKFFLDNFSKKKGFTPVTVVVKTDSYAGKVEVEYNSEKKTAYYNVNSNQYEALFYIEVPITATYKVCTFNATVFDYQNIKSDKKSISYQVSGSGDLAINHPMGDYSIKCEMLPPNSEQISKSAVKPLNIYNQPERDPNASDSKKIESIYKIADFLNVKVESKYQKKIINGKTYTYCNVYAYDFTHLSKAYIPRVWWNDDCDVFIWKQNTLTTNCKSKFIERLRNGERIYAEPGVTANEVPANQLFFWFEKYGEEFGWNRIKGASIFQEHEFILNKANEGKICIVTAKVKNLSSSGHIAIVLPEYGTHTVERDINNDITKLLTSQAGDDNWKVQTDDFSSIYTSKYDHAFYWHY